MYPRALSLAPSFSTTTPLNTLISSHTIQHHLYVDDTQIFISAPKTFITAISQLRDRIADISTWMTFKIQSLNISETECILIGRPQQSKISNPSLSLPWNPPISHTDFACNLSCISDFNLNFSKQISSLSSCLQLSYLWPSPHQAHFRPQNSIATSLVHSKLDYCNYL